MNKYRIQIKGKGVKEFLRYLVIKNIKLYNIYCKDDELRITVLGDDYFKILSMKTKYKIKIINSYGIYKIKYLVLKYKFILILIFITLFFIILASRLIFKIEVVHQKEEIRNIVLNDLKQFGISKYKFRVSYKKKEEIKNKILEKEKDRIEWIEIDNIGTKYIINVEERKLNPKVEEDYPRDIVASKDAMILHIESETGEIVKKKYDYVRKGETIISGTIMKKDKEVKKVKASGKVLGEVWYKVEVELPEYYHEEIRTGKSKKAISLKLINKKISFPFTKKDKVYDIEDKEIIGNKLLPIKLVIEEKHELKIIDKKYTLENSEEEAFNKAIESLNNKIKGEYKILNKKVLKKTINNSKIIIDMFFKVQEEITDYKKISSELKEGEASENSFKHY